MRCDAGFSHDVTLTMMGYVTNKASKTHEKNNVVLIVLSNYTLNSISGQMNSLDLAIVNQYRSLSLE